VNNKGKTIFNLNVYAQSIPAQDIYDFDDALEENFQTIDWDEREQNLPEITEDEVTGYLADDFEEEIQEDIERQNLKEQEPEVPLEITDEEIPEFDTTLDAVNWAIENNKVVRINYITQGNLPRGGRKLKREIGLPAGSHITRIVEPHHVFTAGTGNNLTVTYDRSIRGIRAYIVDNIVNYVFTGKNFRKRMRVLPGQDNSGKIKPKNTINKKVKPMNNEIFEQLETVGNILENKGLVKSASIVTNSMKTLLQVKTSQYVGVQGYYVRNNRCWQNCYRQKRTNEANAQKVWFECLEEYQKSINNNGTEWDKYASEEDNNLVKTASKEQKEAYLKEAKIILKSIEEKVKKGMGTGESVFITLEEREHVHVDKIADVAQHLTFIADNLNEKGQEELSKKIAEVTMGIIKEADEYGYGGFQSKGNLGGAWQATRGLFSGKGRIKNVVSRLSNLANTAGEFANELGNISYYQQGAQQTKTPTPAAAPGTQVDLSSTPIDAGATGQGGTSVTPVDTTIPSLGVQGRNELGKYGPRQQLTQNVDTGVMPSRAQGRNRKGNYSNKVDISPRSYYAKSHKKIKKAQRPASNIGLLNQQLIELVENLNNEAAKLGQIAGSAKETEVRDMANRAAGAIGDFLRSKAIVGVGNQVSKDPNFFLNNPEAANTLSIAFRKFSDLINKITGSGGVQQTYQPNQTDMTGVSDVPGAPGAPGEEWETSRGREEIPMSLQGDDTVSSPGDLDITTIQSYIDSLIQIGGADEVKELQILKQQIDDALQLNNVA
jgi:hypothetical protein